MHHFFQVAVFQRLVTVLVQRQHRAFCQPRVHPERQAGSHQHLVEAGRDHLRERLATVLGRPGHAGPAVIDVLPIGLRKAFGGRDLSIDEGHAFFVAIAVQRRDHFCGIASRFVQYAINQRAIKAVPQQLTMGTDIKQFMEHETHVTQRCLEAHTRPFYIGKDWFVPPCR
ncbi:hypothetical protein D3C78_1088770 [compost metagenome]